MSYVLSDLIGAAEPSFTNELRQLEADSGHPGADVILISDIAKILRQKLRELGLDPNDTTGIELYHALQSLLLQHDKFLRQSISTGQSGSLNALIPQIIDRVKALPIPKSSWSLKPSAAKRLVKQTPPRKLMRQLNYRSVDSLLKRETIEQIYIGIQLTESTSWRRRFIASYKQLKANDFEDRPINILFQSQPHLIDSVHNYVIDHDQNMLVLPELGTIAVLPFNTEPAVGGVVLVTVWLLESINELKQISSYLKLHQVKPNFPQLLIKSLLSNELSDFNLAGRNFAWEAIYHLYGKPNHNLPDELGLHIQSEDMAVVDPHELLYKLEPALSFWRGLRHVGMLDEGFPVSFNIKDIMTSLNQQVPYDLRQANNLRQALWQELSARYLAQPSFERLLLDQFSGEEEAEAWLSGQEMWA